MTPLPLYRYAGVAAVTCAVLLVLNAARRGGLVPENAVTHAIAPFAALIGLLAFVGIYLWQRKETGLLGLIGFVLNAAGLAGAFAIEYIIHFVFPYLTSAQVTAIITGPTARAFLVTAACLIAGVLLFGITGLRAAVLPRPALTLYIAGMIPGALRNQIPEPLYLSGLVLAAVGVAWLGVTLWRASTVPRAIATSH
ncbi:hypothetical protein GCM10009677_40300 [Sphaerisporangium rubeum]|uniref:Vacuolar-type H+-ATPase subunit I/STV1 n=1 Tax=Sphaerisporangium rubeum TaxID=321317 RepID=A0A7X0IHQ8_9ACTN|nr:hypothetical protein [Sphaerisporangium rubeum]MBB6475411.1 vacuolar-type H+-ATPase subunit I/STV1 [Sphaerisporangium rubeum]